MLTDSSYPLTSSKEESLPLGDSELDSFANLANKVVDAAGEIIRKHSLARGNFFEVSDANIPSWTTIAAEAEKAMISLILKDFADHTVCGKQSGWSNCSGTTTPEFVWVLDPIDAVVHNGKLVIGCISNPITGIKTVGMMGKTTRNGDLLKTRASEHLEQAYVDIKDPDYNKEAKYAYNRLAYKVGETFFNGNCIAYSELAAGMLQVVVDFPIVEGAGGIITDWEGNQLSWQPSPESSIP
ncbi:unnamed protein product [Withania somnifera]